MPKLQVQQFLRDIVVKAIDLWVKRQFHSESGPAGAVHDTNDSEGDTGDIIISRPVVLQGAAPQTMSGFIN